MRIANVLAQATLQITGHVTTQLQNNIFQSLTSRDIKDKDHTLPTRVLSEMFVPISKLQVRETHIIRTFTICVINTVHAQ
jgi:hypothetical protein